ncbi:MAG TPA: hypothetical protein VEK07_02085 [Polyangiaceae bacterium]|nr:hypothetical protein [Polyangiaceae bacterium]
MSHDNGRGIASVERVARRAERRIRMARSVRATVYALCGALAFAIIDVSLRKVGAIGESTARALLATAAASVALAAAVAWRSRLPARAGARALDRFHGYSDRLSSALAFAERPGDQQTPLMRAAIEDAITIASHSRPGAAVPIGFPRASAGVAGLSGVLLGVMLFEVRVHRVVAHTQTIDPIEMAGDDLDDVKDFLKQIEERQLSDETKAAADQFNRLVEDIANRRLDRAEAFRRLEALEEKLLTRDAADDKTLERQVEAVGEELEKADLTRPTGIALSNDRLDRARDAMRELAHKLRGASGPVDKAKLDRLREALAKAALSAQDRQTELERRRERLADDILKAKRSAEDGGPDEEHSLLDKKTAELDRLDRELEEQRGAGQRLDRLDRELEQAAEDLMKDLGLSAQDLDQGAEDINRLDQEQMTERDKEELRQKLQELRELLRQQGGDGKSQLVRLKRFGRMARGQGGGGSGRTGDGPQNGGDSQGGPQAGNGPEGGSSSQGDQQGQGAGQGSGAGQESWIVGPNGEKILMLSKGSGGSSAQQGAGDGRREGPSRWGEGHDPNVQGKATSSAMGTEDTQVQGAAGQGPSRSQVILGAAERGFSARGYHKVYTEYHQQAEQSLARDEIPGGYRFYVKRYFQLIRPRDTP